MITSLVVFLRYNSGPGGWVLTPTPQLLFLPLRKEDPVWDFGRVPEDLSSSVPGATQAEFRSSGF